MSCVELMIYAIIQRNQGRIGQRLPVATQEHF